MEKFQEIHFITGKGGVGKSTLAAAMAKSFASQGHSTLLVELGNLSFYKDFFDLPMVEYKPTKIAENLDLAMWSGKESLREYVLHLIRIESLYNLFFENSVSRALMNVAPALSELAILGKITSGGRNMGPPMPYERIVVDAYSTGHFLALLKAPAGMAEVVRYGPMSVQCNGILQEIRNQKVCHFHIVTLAEDMPILEGLELQEKLQQELGLKSKFWLNKTLQSQSSDQIGTPAFQDYLKLRTQAESIALNKLNTMQPCRVIPTYFEDDPWKLIAKMSEAVTSV
jgi:anion-transporting  ArsA/GET3 family ATPase